MSIHVHNTNTVIISLGRSTHADIRFNSSREVMKRTTQKLRDKGKAYIYLRTKCRSGDNNLIFLPQPGRFTAPKTTNQYQKNSLSFNTSLWRSSAWLVYSCKSIGMTVMCTYQGGNLQRCILPTDGRWWLGFPWPNLVWRLHTETHTRQLQEATIRALS